MSNIRLHEIAQFFKLLIIFSFGISAIFSCASTGSLTGGPKDTAPPKLDSLRSTPNFQKFFQKQDLVFYFDEFIEVKDAVNQVLVTPPMTYLPKIEARGKKINFRFNEKEVLRENVTYTIHFGDAIVDFREGNKLQNFSFVCSTGPYIDSMSLSGSIYDALTGKPAENFLVMLHENLSDSAVVKLKPYYSVKTDKQGKFNFQNIKADTFRIFAVKDGNVNFKYDLPTEEIAYLNDLVILSQDTISPDLNMVSSLPVPKRKLLAKNTKSFGKVSLQYNTSPFGVNLRIPETGVIYFEDISGDTLHIYYQTQRDSISVMADQDTIKFKIDGKALWAKNSRFSRTVTNFSESMLLSDTIGISFNVPFDNIVEDSITISDTVGILSGWTWRKSKNGRTLFILNNTWRSGMPYKILIPKGAVKDIYSRTLDTMRFSFQFLPPEKLTTLQLSVNDLDSSSVYVVRLFKDSKVFFEKSMSNSKVINYTIKGLLPQEYKVDIIEDRNQNGRWDPADYWNLQQPEIIKSFNTHRLRENRLEEFIVSFREQLGSSTSEIDQNKQSFPQGNQKNRG